MPPVVGSVRITIGCFDSPPAIIRIKRILVRCLTRKSWSQQPVKGTSVVAETLRERISAPLAHLSGADELAELSNLLGAIQAGNPAESLPAIRTLRAWLRLKEHEAVDVARAERIPWQAIGDQLGVPVETVWRTHHNTFDASDTRDR